LVDKGDLAVSPKIEAMNSSVHDGSIPIRFLRSKGKTQKFPLFTQSKNLNVIQLAMDRILIPV
jgi:hypothetical protein